MTCSKCTYWDRSFDKGWSAEGFGKCSVEEGEFSPRTKIYVLSFDDYDILTRNDFFCAEYKETSAVE